MSTTPQAILFYNPVWTVNDLIGEPNDGGFIYFYRSENPTELKTVYKDSLLTTPWPNPIEFDVTGAQDDNYPIYGTDDEPYRVVITNSLGVTVRSFDPFPASDSGSPVIPDQEITNQIPNGQVNDALILEYSPVPASIENIVPGHDFIKSNTSATDTLTVEQLTIGQSDIPAYPQYQINYTCTGPGTSETTKDYIVYLSDPFAYSNTQMTAALSAVSATSNTLGILFVQNFGTGGTPSAEVVTPIGTQALTPQEEAYDFTFQVPNASGKSLGTNNDGYTAIIYRLPFNAACNISFTNLGLYFGAQAPVYQYKPAWQSKLEAIGSEFPILASLPVSNYNPADGNYELLLISGVMTWVPLAGKMEEWPTNTPPPTALLCNGYPRYSHDFYNLAQVNLVEEWGTGPEGFTASLSTATVTATCFSDGTVVAGGAGTSGFTYTQASVGSSSTKGEAEIVIPAASAITDGSYFFINSPSTEYAVVFSLKNRTFIDTSSVALTGKKIIKVVFEGDETNAEMGARVESQLKIAHFRVPDVRGLISRMPNFGATAVLPAVQALTLTSTANHSAITFAIVGLDENGDPDTEDLAGPNANTVTSTKTWSAITSITPHGAVATTGVEAGIDGDDDAFCLIQTTAGATALIINGIYGRDPDYATRYAMYTGGATADNVGSQQQNQNLRHNHDYYLEPGSGQSGGDQTAGGNYDTPLETSKDGGNQSNPNNVYVNKIIYY